MTPDDLRARSRAFALDVIRLYSSLQRDDVVRVIGPQLLRCATGVAANYRAVGRSRSDREFASRLAVVVEEADEAEFWLDVLRTEHLGPAEPLRALNAEAGELRAIFAASRRTVLARLKRRTADPTRPKTPDRPQRPGSGDHQISKSPNLKCP